jgi:methylated-DNA-[protein]-cysteine S-methyltransferase
MEQSYLAFTESQFGRICIMWRYIKGMARIERVLLPNETKEISENLLSLMDIADEKSCRETDTVIGKINSLLRGESVKFDLKIIQLAACPPFQKKVLLAEHGIPHGWVSTYGRIAQHIGTPNGARAVGTALAKNPFPLIIPCHRAVRADGQLGGFRGGVEMKRALLLLEDVEVDVNNRVRTNKFYY